MAPPPPKRGGAAPAPEPSLAAAEQLEKVVRVNVALVPAAGMNSGDQWAQRRVTKPGLAEKNQKKKRSGSADDDVSLYFIHPGGLDQVTNRDFGRSP